MIDKTLADKDGYSMLVDGQTRAMVISSNAMIAKVWSIFWWWILVKNLRLQFGRDFEAEFWSRNWGWSLGKIWCCSRFWNKCLVDILKLKFGRDSEAKVWSKFWRRSLVKILRLNFDRIVLWLKSGYFGESTQHFLVMVLLSPSIIIYILHCHNIGDHDQSQISSDRKEG